MYSCCDDCGGVVVVDGVVTVVRIGVSKLENI